jgi:hypothetical protein
MRLGFLRREVARHCHAGLPKAHFSYITQNWRGKPLRSFQTIVNLIAATTTKTGLKVHAELNTETYQSGIKVSDADLAQVKIRRDKFHGDWNYEIEPRYSSC